jgi:hypothetical protein
MNNIIILEILNKYYFARCSLQLEFIENLNNYPEKIKTLLA